MYIGIFLLWGFPFLRDFPLQANVIGCCFQRKCGIAARGRHGRGRHGHRSRVGQSPRWTTPRSLTATACCSDHRRRSEARGRSRSSGAPRNHTRGEIGPVAWSVGKYRLFCDMRHEQLHCGERHCLIRHISIRISFVTHTHTHQK